jgi:RNA polymerase sigma factor for flagellar operon FliA
MNTVSDVYSPGQADIGALWKQYKASGSIKLRDELLVRYIPLVKQIVRRMMPKYNNHNEYEDLVNCGIIGLIDAVDKFDLGHGVKFETYAVTRVRGEILDYMRAQDWAPSSLRKKITAITNTYEQLESAGGTPPTDSQVAESMGLSVAQVQKVMAKTHVFNLVNFEDTLSSCYAMNDVAAHEDETPENVLLGKELKQVLTQMIQDLPEKEKLVISLYYYEELMLKEIAEIMEVSESRVSQIHSKVLGKMRAQLQKMM